ncbi:MAG: F0F1 ATP synthase subunit A [Candidatus Saccharimonadales bacterium]
MLLSNFANESGIHVSLKAETIFTVGPLHVTNAIIYGFICSVAIVTLMVLGARKIKLRPTKGLFHNVIEYIVDFIINLLEGAFGSREKAAKFAPYFGVYFIFIIFSNLFELLPFVGESVFHSSGEGLKTVLFRPFTADLNGTIALAVIAIIMVQYLSIKEQGLKGHAQHYFTDKPANPINFFIGMLEVFGEFTRILSLSLRLFLNTAVGEILITVFTSLILKEGRTPLAVIPIFMFEGLVAFIQAYVFTVLAGTYLGLAINHVDATGHEIHDDHQPPLKKVETTGSADG